MRSPAVSPDAVEARRAAVVDARELADFSWVWLVAGIAWIIGALVILPFDAAPIATIGVIVGCMSIVRRLRA